MTESKVAYPIHLLLSGRRCLVVGGGAVAYRKVCGLLAAGALVTVVATRMIPELLSLDKGSAISFRQRAYQAGDLESMTLVFAATDDPALNVAIVADCRERRIFCCTVDHHWPSGDFITPASFHYQGVTVSISTGGRDCKKSKRVREILERQLKNTL